MDNLLEMKGIYKNFPGVKALDNVDFYLKKGEIHALMGENGAGKSTLIKVLTGVEEFETGQIILEGKKSIINKSPKEAQANGISTVYQEVNLCPNISVAENLFLDREPRKFGLIDWKKMNKTAKELLDKLDINIDVTKPTEHYSIAIQQKVISSNPRSTVGTSTEIYDYLKLLFARIGRTFSPVSGQEVRKDSVSDVIDFIQKNEGKTYTLRSPLHYETDTFKNTLNTLKLSGFTRLEINGNTASIEDLEAFNFVPEKGMDIHLIIDRFLYEDDESFLQRLADSIQIAFYEGRGYCSLKDAENEKVTNFSNKFELDGIEFLEPNIHFFSFYS